MLTLGCSLLTKLYPTLGSSTTRLLYIGSGSCHYARLLSSHPAAAAAAATESTPVGTSIASATVDKNALSRLRKKTGYSFVNCRKALEIFAGDEVQAENWLREQAVKEGWSKALKLQTRPMSQGLVGILSNKSIGVMVEMNCETDFVAKNARFQHLVRSVVSTCWQQAAQQLASLGSSNDSHKIILSGDDVMQLKMDSGQTVKEYIVSEITSIGENMAARRALAFAAANETDFVGQYVHLAGLPAPELGKEGGVSLGKYAALVAVRRSAVTDGSAGAASEEDMQSVATQIGQHVVGMRPLVLDDETDTVKNDRPLRGDPAAPVNIDAKGAVAAQPATEPEPRALLRQEFLMDSSVTVREWLQEKRFDVVNFARFEVGEDLVDSAADPRAVGNVSP